MCRQLKHLQEGRGQGSGKSKTFMGLSVLLAPTLWNICGTFFCVSQTGVILDEQILKTSKSRIWFCSYAFKVKDAVRQLRIIRYRHADHKQTLVQNMHICTCPTRLSHKFSVKGKYSVIHWNMASTTLDLLGTHVLQYHVLQLCWRDCRTVSQMHGSGEVHSTVISPKRPYYYL